MNELDFTALVRKEIKKFAIASGIPYDPPNPLLDFDVEANKWHHVNAYCMARLSVLAYRDEDQVREQLAEAAIDDSCIKWFQDQNTDSKENTDTQGFGFIWSGNAFLCFRGTESKRDVMIDLKNRKVRFDGQNGLLGRVHEGFLEAMGSVWPDIERFLANHRADYKQVWVTGHSLGGAIATLVAAQVVHSENLGVLAGLYTFGQPRVGDRIFKNEFTERIGGVPVRQERVFRIYRAADPVAMIPRIGYRHISGRRCYISRSGALTIGGRRRQKYFDRFMTYVFTLPKVIGRPGRITELRALVSDHYSSGYLAKLRDNLLSANTLKSDTHA